VHIRLARRQRPSHGSVVGRPAELGGAIRDAPFPCHDHRGLFRRVLVPVGSSGPAGDDAVELAARMGHTAGAQLRLVHVRVWDPPVPRGGGRYFPETSEEATAVLENALTRAWACEVKASGVVVDAERSWVAAAILTEAFNWQADAIVLAQPAPRVMRLARWDKASWQVMRGASCPVVLVYQRRA
jgi:nucleotide-binding universal stress UspA family protein